MKLDHVEVSSERRRLPGRTERRGFRTGFPTWGIVAFGGVFQCVGIAVMLVGLRVIPVDPAGVHAPWWVLTVFGAVFALAGMGAEGMAVRQILAERHRREAIRRHGDNPAMRDYAWSPAGFMPPRWKRGLTALAGALGLTLFLSIFNWWAFGTRSPFMVKAVVALFDLILVAVWWEAALRMGRALKFGGSRIEFTRFPYQTGAPVVIRWHAPSGLSVAYGARFTLRCVEEWFEHTGSGRNRSAHMVHEEVWSATLRDGGGRRLLPEREVELRFDPPAGLPETALTADRPVFWELEAHLELPGLDFEETYLVPVYGASFDAGKTALPIDPPP
jgi:hypothetical protein